MKTALDKPEEISGKMWQDRGVDARRFAWAHGWEHGDKMISPYGLTRFRDA